MHSRDYVARLAAETGFTVELLDTDVHEYADGLPVTGLIVGLRRGKRESIDATF